mgnify:CR=1 FL=1
MPITDHYNPIWDTTRRSFPERAYEDDDVILASNFECGNGYNFRKLPSGRYAVDIEPEPGDHHFSGSGCYFCFVALNKHDTPRTIAFDIRAQDASWDRQRRDRIETFLTEHPNEVPPLSFEGSSRFAIARSGDIWTHVPDDQMLRAIDYHGLAFSYDLPDGSEDHAATYFSNYHWYPYTEMTNYLKRQAEQHPQITLFSLSKSVQDRDIWVVELGNASPDAPVIVCAATPQADEMGNWACRANLEFLLSGTPEAEAILQRHRVCLIPHPNPDGAVLGYMVSDAADKFPYFMGAQTIAGDPEAPIEQVALWKYLQQKRPWLFIEWHSNHWNWRPGHTLIRYAPELAENPVIRRIWDNWDRRLEALPNSFDEAGGRTDRTNAYTISLGLGVATELNGIPIMLKVHDKYPLHETLDYVNQCLRAATDAYEEEIG